MHSTRRTYDMMDVCSLRPFQRKNLFIKGLESFPRPIHRGVFFILRLTFPLLKRVVPRIRRNVCLWWAFFLYHSLSEPQKKECKINIFLGLENNCGATGHVWITINGTRLSRRKKGPSELKCKLEKLGSDGQFVYWVKRPAPRD